MDISEVNIIAEVKWVYEDELPIWVDDEIYKILYPISEIKDGVRMFPFIVLCGQEIALCNLN